MGPAALVRAAVVIGAALDAVRLLERAEVVRDRLRVLGHVGTRTVAADTDVAEVVLGGRQC